MKFQFDWAESDRSNLTVLIDKMFFLSGTFEPSVVLPISYLSGNNIVWYVFAIGLQFAVFNWALYSVAFVIGAKILHLQAQFKILLIIIGYAMIGTVILNALFTIYYVVMPPLYFYIDTVRPVSLFQNLVWYTFITNLFVPVWSMIITAGAVRAGFNLTWARSLILGIIAFLPYYLVRFFLGG
jgi:hypothetical protein